MRNLVYLACPYNHKSKKVRDLRFRKVTKKAGQLMCMGYNIFSPITHCHPIANCHSLPKGWDFWKNIDIAYLRNSRELFVYCLNGWEKSVGVQAEIKIATKMGIPIKYIKE